MSASMKFTDRPSRSGNGAGANDSPLPLLDPSVDRLKETIRLLEAVVDNFPGGISVYDKDLRMVLCNEQQRKLLDYPDEIFASGYPTLEDMYRYNARRGEYGPGDVEQQVKARMELAREARAHVFERTRPNGTVLEVRGVPLEGGGFLTAYLDVTEQRRTQALIARLARYDALTELPNRVLFRDRLEQALARAKRGEKIALLYTDLDGFKPINDRFGHAAGDALLRAVADRLHKNQRETDTVARLGGDEFVFIQTAIKEELVDSATLARRLIRSISAPYEIAGKTIVVGASMGIAFAPRHGTEPDDLIHKADLALYHSKANGRGRFSVYDPRMDRT
jgi:diguanylate cyclase (GGDEF)-like protein